jgi:glutamate synthase domain-containing protein 2
LPFTLPAVLPSSVKKKIANDLRKYEKWRLINIKISSSANKMAIRQIMAAANPDTIEIQKTI